MVNQTLLPMIKTKLNNPKDKLLKELNEQNQKFERIRKAYINGSFTIEEYDNEKEIVENTIKILEEKIKECDLCNELKFTPEDILIKRDLDYINGLVYPKEYEENTYMWKDYTRSEKSDLIMRYVDYVELEYYSKNKVRIGEVYFRESMCKPCNELYDAGFLAKTDYALLGNIVTKLRFSEYLPIEKVSEIVFTLRQYYNVGYFEETYYYEDKVMFFNNYENRNIVRIFPIEDYKKMDKLDKLQLGVIYIGNNEKCLIDNKEDLFIHIWTTIYETIISFSLGTILGIIIAIILWWNDFLYKVIDPYLTIINSLPKVAIGPIIIIFFGANIKSIIIMALLISLIVTIITVYNGFIETDKNKINLLKSFKATKYQIFKLVILPSSYNTIISSLKINISMTLIGVIMGEFLVSKQGIGYLITYGSQVFNLNLVMSGIIILLIVSYLMYLIVSYIEKILIKKD